MLFVLTFIESFATILVERGLYFLTRDRLGFSDPLNLWLALAFGAAYVSGSLISHPLAMRFGEKRLLRAALLSQAALCAVLVGALLGANPPAAVVFVCTALLGSLYGLKWPVIESYACANRTPREMARAVGVFALGWSTPVPLALAAAGPLIAWRPWAMLAAAGGVSIVSLLLVRALAPVVAHLDHAHPERPSGGEVRRIGALLIGSRWGMLLGYGSMWVLAALMPGIFARLGVPVATATGLSALLDVARVAAFAILWRWEGWHGRRDILAIAFVALPISFAVVLSGANLPVVLAGELLFGLAAGVLYHASLYYAMVAMNASVAAGGGHEGLVGAGFAIGPACGLLGVALAPAFGGNLPGILAGIAPLLVFSAVGTGRALLRGGPAGGETRGRR